MAEIVVVHGYPGSGKSTHSERLRHESVEGKDIIHVSAGNRLRGIRTGESESVFQDFINDPDAPSPLPHDIVNGVIFEHIPSGANGTLALIDGYPRLEGAVDTFLDAVEEGDHRLLGCVSLEVSLETSVQRLISRGSRGGERLYGGNNFEEFARHRHSEHDTHTKKAVDKLGETVPVIDIDANLDINVVWGSFRRSIGDLALGLVSKYNTRVR